MTHAHRSFQEEEEEEEEGGWWCKRIDAGKRELGQGTRTTEFIHECAPFYGSGERSATRMQDDCASAENGSYDAFGV